METSPPRLIDLHTDWILQYATESTDFDPALYEQVTRRLGQAEGYLRATRAAILSCYRDAEDWARQADPWAALGNLIARIEAEFSGRLLIGPEDWARWEDDPESLGWGVLGIEGFDALIREEGDLRRLEGLFRRGVRLFQPVYTSTSLLGGSSAPGDDRGMTELGRGFLEALVEVAGVDGPRPMLDLAHLNPNACGEVLDWFESDDSRAGRLLPVYSHGALRHEGYTLPRALTVENLARLRAMGGVIGLGVTPPFYASLEELRRGIEAAAALPFLGVKGFAGIAIGTDFLGVDQVAPGLENASAVVTALRASFEPATADALIQGNARRLLAKVVGVEISREPPRTPGG